MNDAFRRTSWFHRYLRFLLGGGADIWCLPFTRHFTSTSTSFLEIPVSWCSRSKYSVDVAVWCSRLQQTVEEACLSSEPIPNCRFQRENEPISNCRFQGESDGRLRIGVMLPGVCPIRCMQGCRLKVLFVYSSVNTNTYQFQGLIEFPFQIPEQRRNATDFDIKHVERLVLETWVPWMRQETFSWKTFLVSAKTASSKSLSFLQLRTFSIIFTEKKPWNI